MVRKRKRVVTAYSAMTACTRKVNLGFLELHASCVGSRQLHDRPKHLTAEVIQYACSLLRVLLNIIGSAQKGLTQIEASTLKSVPQDLSCSSMRISWYLTGAILRC